MARRMALSLSRCSRRASAFLPRASRSLAEALLAALIRARSAFRLFISFWMLSSSSRASVRAAFRAFTSFSVSLRSFFPWSRWPGRVEREPFRASRSPSTASACQERVPLFWERVSRAALSWSKPLAAE